VVFESHCERRKRYVFSFVLNVASDMFLHKGGDRLFHTAGPLYAKLRCPVEVWTRGSRTQWVDADRSRGRPRTRTRSSRRYVSQTSAELSVVHNGESWLTWDVLPTDLYIFIQMPYLLFTPNHIM